MSAVTDWAADAFFDEPPLESLDGGTTSAGALWHGISPRWGHSMHTMCSYHGMFPARVAHYFVQRYSRPGDVVLDPFSGRGTTPLQARLADRRVICNDLNPLAYVLSKAKSDPPPWAAVEAFVTELEKSYGRTKQVDPDVSDDIRMLYHESTLRQLCFIRARLTSKPITSWSPEELMVAGSLAGIMHGSWRRDGTSQYLSISMPNTFSMAPTYVRKFIAEHGLMKLPQDVFERLRDKLARLYLDDIAGTAGMAYHQDATTLLRGADIAPGSADLIVTSPPYLQVVNYGTANWIRLWLLGLDGVGWERGEGRKILNARLDHNHTYDSYAEFMLRTLTGIERALAKDGVAVLVMGDVSNPGETEALALAGKIWDDLGSQTELQLLEMIEDHLQTQNKVSRIWGETKGQATNRDCALVVARKDGEPYIGQPEVCWDEPYRDAGPDAAHDRLKQRRVVS
jgi:hypothetical protein